MSINVASSRIAHAVVLCAFAGALLSLPVSSKAASKTLTISGTPAATVVAGAEYSFQPTAKDTERSRIKFDIYNKPYWAKFDGNTGKLSGTPHRFDIGTYKDITIRLTDWHGFVTTVPFSITVTKPVTSAPSTPVSSAPTTSGGRGSTSSSSAPSAPATSTQTTSTQTTSTQTSSGSVTLDWTPPTENTDGSAMTNLAGYTVHYGTDPSKLTQSIKTSNAGLATLVVDNLTAGTWYFTVTSFNSQGVESTNSNVVSTQVL